MILHAMFEMCLERNTPETNAVFEHLKDHTILSLRIRKISVKEGRKAVPRELFNEHKKSSIKLGELLSKCFEKCQFKLEDCSWDTRDILPREEEATILAPEG